jgi:chaperonin GroEL
MIAEAMEKVGNEGVITVEEAKSLETELDVVEGMQFDRGYLSPYFVTDSEKMHLRTGRSLHPAAREEAVEPAGDAAGSRKRGAERQAAADHRRGHRGRGAGHPGGQQAARRPEGRGRQGARLRRSSQGDARGHRDPDRRQVISEDLGIKLENVTLDMLGTAKRVSITKDETTIVDGAARRRTSRPVAARSRARSRTTTSDYDREKLQERLAKLAGGVAVIRVGGATEVEVKERKDRVDDAMNATRAAVEEGIVPGGGTALLYALKALEGLKVENDDQKVGIDIVRRALASAGRRSRRTRARTAP